MFVAVTYLPFISGLTVAAKFAVYTCGITCDSSKYTGQNPLGVGMNIGGVLGGICCSGSGDTGRGSVASDLGTLGGVSGCSTVCFIRTLAAGAGFDVGVANGAFRGVLKRHQ